MAFSKVSSMLVFLLLLVLVFPHMDKALGEQMQHRKLKETEHPDQLVTVQRRALRFGVFKGWCIRNCKKGSDFLGSLPKPPSPPPRFPKGRLPPPPRFSKGKNV
ncbi:hypothetical protein IGI04_011131 [Brassica rapa subsp. trilocularis]|uniref:Uncharacterized protein n=1 Tax=Brassica rapa subsp. trilocularis TaxID=1813537 RepID=A0ABQ7N270_BRACM|nr:hypothetical protein IGI04_011131 [Brassica rapa subsp. trilocularis]